LVLGHIAAAEQRRALFTVLGELAGVILEVKTQTKTNVQGVGLEVGRLGASLISYKFDRDQEREADKTGFAYMVDAGFNPLGAVRLAETMQRYGAGGIGLFFDNHPGWPERTERFQSLIRESAKAQATIARTGEKTMLATASAGARQPPVALAPTYQASEAEKLLIEGLVALDKRDFPAAVAAIRTSTAWGYAPAQAALGRMYSEGLSGLPKDEVEAVRLYRLAAKQSNSDAMNNLGFMYENGRGGLSVDEAEAVRLYRLAVRLSNAQAMNNLATMYQRGGGDLPKSEIKAAELYRLAADRGNADAQVGLGTMYTRGEGGLRTDTAEALRLFQLSAAQGYAQGQFNLGVMYEFGWGGVAQDREVAVSWYRKAAAQGFAIAAQRLNNLHVN
jgi:TPR repeat protein